LSLREGINQNKPGEERMVIQVREERLPLLSAMQSMFAIDSQDQNDFDC
jgi:hypothetical protein